MRDFEVNFLKITTDRMIAKKISPLISANYISSQKAIHFGIYIEEKEVILRK